DPGISSLVHHNISWNNGASGTNNWSLPSGFDLWASNSSADPLFVDTAGGDYSLSELAAGQAADSPAIGRGSAPIGIADIDGSTRSDGASDSGHANPGYHAQASALGSGVAVIAPPTPARIHVDCVDGDDSRSRWEVSRLWDGWATISRALADATAGDTIIIRDGTCAEAVEIETADLRLQAENPLGAIIEPPAGLTGVRIEADRVTLADLLIRSDKEGIRAAAENSDTSLFEVHLSGLLVEKLPAGTAIATNGIRLNNTFDAIVDSCVVRGAAQTGIAVLSDEIAAASGGGRNYLRNNLVTGSGEWGIHIDSEAPAPVSSGHLVAFNTLYGNGTTGGQGGLRLQNAIGELRDNIVVGNSGRGIKSDTAPLLLHHNLVFANPVAYDTQISAMPTAWDNRARDPLFRDPSGGDFRLQQSAAGDGATSPAVDAGSAEPVPAGISGSTRGDAASDIGVADLGWHQSATAATEIPSLSAPPADLGRTIFVDAALGDNTYHLFETTDQERPWQTIGRSLRSTGAQAGDTVVVRAGTYNESVETNLDGVTILAEPGVILQAGGLSGFFVENSDITIDGFRIEGALHGVRGSGATRLTVRRTTIAAPSSTGIKLSDSTDAILDSNRIESATGRSIHATDSAGLYIRNNLLLASGSWAIHLDTADGAPATDSTLVAFNTIDGSGTGGIRFENTTGTIRDNIVNASGTMAVKTDTAPVDVHHNDLHDAVLLFDEKSGEEPRRWSNSTLAPLFVDPTSGDFRLQSQSAGDAQTSPLLDRGSADAASALVDISGSTTRDGTADTGAVDPGHHENAIPTAVRPLAGPPYSAIAGTGGTFHVSQAGDNSRTSGEATAPGGAWRTISYAIGQLATGDTLLIAAGDYPEAFSVPSDGVHIAGSGALGDTRILPPAGTVGIGLSGRTNVRIENLVIEGGSQSIRAEATSGLRIHRVASLNSAAVGIQILDSTDAWVDSSIVTGAGDEGLLLLRSDNHDTPNTLIYTNSGWGISLDNDAAADPAPAISTGNLLAFNTVHTNGNGV
ncbi:MAG: right-handed parallel beta-helix repeat-containing protein, partial [bacterium]